MASRRSVENSRRSSPFRSSADVLINTSRASARSRASPTADSSRRREASTPSAGSASTTGSTGRTRRRRRRSSARSSTRPSSAGPVVGSVAASSTNSRSVQSRARYGETGSYGSSRTPNARSSFRRSSGSLLGTSAGSGLAPRSEPRYPMYSSRRAREGETAPSTPSTITPAQRLRRSRSMVASPSSDRATAASPDNHSGGGGLSASVLGRSRLDGSQVGHRRAGSLYGSLIADSSNVLRDSGTGGTGTGGGTGRYGSSVYDSARYSSLRSGVATPVRDPRHASANTTSEASAIRDAYSSFRTPQADNRLASRRSFRLTTDLGNDDGGDDNGGPGSPGTYGSFRAAARMTGSLSGQSFLDRFYADNGLSPSARGARPVSSSIYASSRYSDRGLTASNGAADGGRLSPDALASPSAGGGGGDPLGDDALAFSDSARYVAPRSPGALERSAGGSFYGGELGARIASPGGGGGGGRWELTDAGFAVGVADHPNRRWRVSMEDAHATYSFMVGDDTFHYFGVFDGHGGKEVADFAADNLHLFMQEELSAMGMLTDAKIQDAIEAAYERIDQAIIESSILNIEAGATAVTVLLRITPAGTRRVYAANVGDSRAVLGKDALSGGTTAVCLTVDHKASIRSEVQRIERSGGFVSKPAIRGAVARVNGVLAVTRAFGDLTLKQVISTPHQDLATLEGRTKFIVIACDGVWDVLSNGAAVDLVREVLDLGGSAGTPQRAAQALVDLSIDKGTTDNVTAMVVKLGV